MQKISLAALARQQLDRAAAAGSRHTAATVYGGHEKVLRQTVIGLSQGARLAEHENPGAATIQVLRGRVRMIVGGQSWEPRTGDLLIVPDARHSLEALQASAVLLTVAKLP
jgi:quercetin dioxygenase-like cupin family protein